MILRIKFLTPVLTLPILFIQTSSTAQKTKKADKIVLTNLEAHVRYLSDGKLEGRRTGSAGEKLAIDYIISQLSNAGVQPKGDNGGWIQAFDIDNGREVSPEAFLVINDRPFVLNKEYFPLAFSATGSIAGSPAIALQESGSPWFQDLRELLEAEAGNPHYDLRGAIRAKAALCFKKGATALILYNSSKRADSLLFDPREKSDPVAIPVVYITKEAKRKYLKDESASLDLKLKVAFSEKKRTGHNVVGFLDNGAASTVVIAAHYDYMGSDSTGRSETSGGRRDTTSIARPWEDDASGIAGTIELARMLAGSKLKSNNYLFIAFSGEDQGAVGSKYGAEHCPVDIRQVNYMLDLDRIDPLVDSAHTLVVGGYGTSPSWWGICREVKEQKTLSYRLDSAYHHPGDYSAFYTRNIPVLALYSGRDNNDCDNELLIVKYIYEIVAGANTRGRLVFTKLIENRP